MAAGLVTVGFITGYAISDEKNVANLESSGTNPAISLLNIGNGPAFTWNETSHDFGDIERNKPVSTTFTFVNSGDEPLVISDIKRSCGCTTPKWPKEPILPGETGVIKVEYNAAAKGTFNKTMTINSNAGMTMNTLIIKGKVFETEGVE